MPATVIQPAISAAATPRAAGAQTALAAPAPAVAQVPARAPINPAKAAIRISLVLLVLALLVYGAVRIWQFFSDSGAAAAGERALPAVSRQLSGAGLSPEDLVAQAGERIARGQWFEPVGAAAYDSIKALEARAGMEAGQALRAELAAAVDARVVQLEQQGKAEEARRLLASALGYLPEDPVLLARRRALEAGR
jgi:hypothetical protein